MSIARVVLGVLLACALSGCSGVKLDGPMFDLPAVVHAKAEVPKDRDPEAVMAALSRLDACALMGSANAVLMAPHRCRLETAPGESVTLTLGTPLARPERYGSELLTVKGARVYFQGPAAGRCKADIPVSFTQTIEVGLSSFRDPTPARCEQVRTLAAAVVTRLANPDATLLRRPAARWNACTALARSLGFRVPTSEHDFVNGLDNCTDPGGLQVELKYGRDLKPSTGFANHGQWSFQHSADPHMRFRRAVAQAPRLGIGRRLGAAASRGAEAGCGKCHRARPAGNARLRRTDLARVA